MKAPYHSEYAQALLDATNLKDKNKKLIPHLGNRENYVVDIRVLRLYMDQGLKLKKVHRVLQFKQEAYLEPYISFNTQKRAAATSDFASTFFKVGT